MSQPQQGEPSGIPEAIRGLRRSLGLTQAQLAQKLLVRPNSISRYEIGNVKPSPRILLILTLLAQGCGEHQVFAAALSDAGFDSNFLASSPHSDSIQPARGDCNV